MAKVSPAKNSFNAGEFSILVQGRTDIDRYPSAMRTMRNYIAAPQGPAIRRSGTNWQHDAFNHTKYSHLVPFIFSDEQASILEFGDLAMRVLTEDGILVYSVSAITSVVTTSPFKFTSAALVAAGAIVGDQVALSGFAVARNLENVITAITAISGNDVTVAATYNGATGAQSGPTAARIFKLVTPYAHTEVRKLIAVQSLDVVYLFCPGYQPRKLARTAATAWTLAAVQYIDGPFAPEPVSPPTLAPSGTGRLLGGTATDSGNSGANFTGAKAFDGNKDTFFESSVQQEGSITYTFASAKVIEGYTIYAARKNTSADGAKDYRPVTWTFEASDDGFATVVELDAKFDYALWQNYRTQYIKINNTTAYLAYRLSIDAVELKGGLKPRVSELYLRETGSQTFTLTASATTEINRGAGFQTTDIGRLMRLYQHDGFWRSVKITARSSTTVVTVELQGEPMLDLKAIRRWRLGVFSDTTGWPVTGAFFNDRLVVGGGAEYPTTIGMSVPQSYELFSPTEANSAVVDDNGITFAPNTRNAALLRWLVADEKGLLAGFGTSEWILKTATDTSAFSARNAKAVKSTERGSAAIRPVVIDKQVVFVQKSRRTLREYAYNYEIDGFKAPSMSLFASHMGVPKFEQLVYAAEPHSIIWCRREDGSMVGLTYNREENVIGWHQHTVGGEIESMAVIPGGVDLQDDLWLVVKRTINATTKRYIEKLMPFWDFSSTLATAHYVDCGLRATFGVATVDVYGLGHLEGQAVVGLADGIEFGFDTVITVTNGHITLPFAAMNIVVGKNFESYAETVNLEAGAQDGTAQGKVAHINNVSVSIWESLKGEIGINNEDTLEDEFVPAMSQMEFREDELGVPQLYTGMLGPLLPPGGYGKRKSLIFRQTKPYPMNVVGLYPQFNTQDR